MKKFSLLLASRQRTGLLRQLLQSIASTANDPSCVEVLVGIDHDDDETQTFANSFTPIKDLSTRFFSRDRSEWMHRDYINWLYPHATGKYILVLNDDTELASKDWDVSGWARLEEYLCDKVDGVVYGSTADDTGDRHSCCFPLFSREAVDAVGWVLPNERKNWGADHDVALIYDNPRVRRKLDIPQIKIKHLTHHNRTRERDSVSHQIEKNFHSSPGPKLDYQGYIDRLAKFITHNKTRPRGRKILVVYNICGISRRENHSYYLPSVHSILAQKFPDFHVCISGCMSSDITKNKLQQAFGAEVSYNWIDQSLPLGVTFNHSVRKCFDFHGGFDAVVYVDSGVSFGTDYDVLTKLWLRHESGRYAMVATLVDTDTGFDQWNLPWPSREDMEIPLGRAMNLHCQLFSRSVYDNYGRRILPDVFASDTSESIFTFMCAALGQRWCVAHDVCLSHRISMDGPSSGFRHRHPLLYRAARSVSEMCGMGHAVGFGYEECRPVLKHDGSWYDENERHKNPVVLRDFIRDNCYFPNGDDFYNNIQSTFVGYRGQDASQEVPDPTITCILVSHNKPQFVNEAIESVLNQTWGEWELLLVDSGVLHDKGYFGWVTDPRIKVMRSPETVDVRQKKAMAPWCFNRALREAKGQLIMYLCDDDILYPNAFETFVEYYRKNNHVLAMYASQDMVSIMPDGEYVSAGERRATERRGACIGGPPLDCQVDYLQLCHRKNLLDLMEPEYWPEGKDTESHADGVFMERIGAITPVYPIDVKTSQNRRTPVSTYGPT